MRADDVECWLLDAGWTLDRPARGSHFMYRHPRYARRLCVVYHGHTMEPFKLKRLASDLTHMGAWAQAEAFRRWAKLPSGRHEQRRGETGQAEGTVMA